MHVVQIHLEIESGIARFQKLVSPWNAAYACLYQMGIPLLKFVVLGTLAKGGLVHCYCKHIYIGVIMIFGSLI